jgi:hypothetical protein
LKQNHSVLTKLKVCWFWLFKHGNGIIVRCGECESTQLDILGKGNINGETYTSRYKCRRCGATATNTETWTKI